MWFKVPIRFAVSLAFLMSAVQTAQSQAGASAERAPAVRAVATITTTVSDMDRSVTFYTRVLSFTKVADQQVELSRAEAGKPGKRTRVVRMSLGDESLELLQFRTIRGRPIPEDSRSNDLWFQHIAIIVSDMGRAYAVLQAHHVQAASVAPQRLPDWNKNAAGIRAFYFKDPDGHPLEILQFPDGKGDPKWHRDSGLLFLGIDHTALVVSNTEASLKFYRDLLGLRIVGQSENYGPEQEKLNNVPGAHLRITTLRAAYGVRIELLEYLTPRSGRKLPYDAQAADLVNRQTVLIAGDPRTISRILQRGFVDGAHIANGSSFSACDPDGHKLLIRTADNRTPIGEVK